MDFKLTEEQELLLESLREYIQRDFPESYLSDCYLNHKYPFELKKGLVDNGFGLIGVPEEYGGVPVDTLTFILVAEEYARLGVPSYVCGGDSIRIDDMLMFGSEEQKAQTMDLVMQGQLAFVLGFTEPQAGSDSSAIACTYTRKNGKVYINGHKSFITHATHAHNMMAVARNSDNPDVISMWWFPLNAPGVKVEPLNKIGFLMTETCEVYLNNVECEEKDLVGKEGAGFLQMLKNYEIERLSMSAGALGQAQAAFEDAARYAGQRMQFDKKIGDFQLIQEKLTRMSAYLQAMRSFLYKTAWEKDNGISVKVNSALCKYMIAQWSGKVIDDAMQIMGGIGYTNDCRISRFWRDVRALRIAGGTDEIMVHIAGRAIVNEWSKKK